MKILRKKYQHLSIYHFILIYHQIIESTAEFKAILRTKGVRLLDRGKVLFLIVIFILFTRSRLRLNKAKIIIEK